MPAISIKKARNMQQSQALKSDAPAASNHVVTLDSSYFENFTAAKMATCQKECLENANILMLKNVIAPDMCDALIKACLSGQVPEWKKDVTDATNETHYRIDDQNNFKSKTPHIFASYNINDISVFDDKNAEVVKHVFGKMATFQQALTETKFGLFDESKVRAHPQVIHYPSGGGYFGAHTHPFLPQKVGLILNLSKKGRDFSRGGTRYFYFGETVDVDEYQDQGDLTVFRYDVPHDVSHVDPEKPLTFLQNTGRWVAILPYY